MPESNEITELLFSWGEGNQQALEKLLPLVENELRKIARAQMRKERDNHTLQTTALINEAYLKLVDANGVNWVNRAQFFGISSTIMRRILMNYARDRNANKRRGKAEHISFDNIQILTPAKTLELLELNDALEKLAEFDPVKSQIVEMKFFGGMSLEEIGEVLEISTSGASLHWRLARAWLQEQLKPTP